MQLFVIFSSEELDFKSFIRAWEPTRILRISYKLATSKYKRFANFDSLQESTFMVLG